MKKVMVYRYDAFTQHPAKGNPAGIIFDADQYSDIEMQNIAFNVGYSECCLLCTSKIADLKLRFFTPKCETSLCGHATIAAVFACMERAEQKDKITLQIETNAGVLEVGYDPHSKEVTMTQLHAKFDVFEGDCGKLAEAIGVTESDFDTRYPIVYGNTGVWTVIVPMRNLEVFGKMNPNNPEFAQVLKQHDHASIHPITFECFDSKHMMHSRHFSSTFAGTVEDAVTGTASGVMGAYYLKYIAQEQAVDLLVEQGNEMGCEGTVRVFAEKMEQEIEVRIAGTAVKTEAIAVDLYE